MLDDIEGEKKFEHVEQFHAKLSKSQKSEKETTLWQKIVGRLFPEPDHSLRELSNRFHEHQRNTKEILTELETIRGELKGKVDSDLFILVAEVIDPLLREINTLHKHSNPSPEIFERYNQWTTKAGMWVHLYTRAGEEENILHYIIDHIKEKAAELINRDIKMILNDVENSRKDRKMLLDVVSPCIKKLQDLKINNGEFDLMNVNSWKQQLDQQRAEIVNQALKLIDDF